MFNRSTLFYPSTGFILITYALVAAAWIVGGDLLLVGLASSPEQLQSWQTWKGVGFALLSTGVLAVFALQRDRNVAVLREKETHYRTLLTGVSPDVALRTRIPLHRGMQLSWANCRSKLELLVGLHNFGCDETGDE